MSYLFAQAMQRYCEFLSKAREAAMTATLDAYGIKPPNGMKGKHVANRKTYSTACKITAKRAWGNKWEEHLDEKWVSWPGVSGAGGQRRKRMQSLISFLFGGEGCSGSPYQCSAVPETDYLLDYRPDYGVSRQAGDGEHQLAGAGQLGGYQRQ